MTLLETDAYDSQMTVDPGTPRVFISYSGLDPISQVSEAIEARGFRPFSTYDLPASKPHLAALLSEMRTAHFAVFVIGSQEEALNTAVELGIALAAGLPTLIVVDSGIELPTIASSLPVVRMPLDDSSALDQALSAIEDLATPSSRGRTHGGDTLGKHADRLLSEWSQLSAEQEAEVSTTGPRNSGVRAEAILAEAFRYAKLRAIQEPTGGSSEADFVVWDASLQPFVGAPLLVDIAAGKLSEQRLKLKVRQVSEFVGQLPAGRWALLVLATDSVDGHTARASAEGGPVLVIPIAELLERMRDESFADIVRTLRNERIHS